MSPELPRQVAATQDATTLEYEEHLRRVVETFPPLTAEQRDRIAAVLQSVLKPAIDEAVVPSPRGRCRKPRSARVATA